LSIEHLKPDKERWSEGDSFLLRTCVGFHAKPPRSKDAKTTWRLIDFAPLRETKPMSSEPNPEECLDPDFHRGRRKGR
jgi:hypothetical protein